MIHFAVQLQYSDDLAWFGEKLGQLANVVFPHQHADKIPGSFFCNLLCVVKKNLFI
jgi:hypothetical protein